MTACSHHTTETGSSLFTRRFAVTGALGAAGLLAMVRSATAQEATPAPGHVSYLFVQICESGTATSTNDRERTYEVVLRHVSGQTMYFSDRPERIAGIIPTDAFLEEVATLAVDPPNTALAFSPEGASDSVEVAVVELTSPSADPAAGTIAYQARIIDMEPQQDDDSAEGETIAPVAELPASFGHATLFIDAIGGNYAKRSRMPDLGGKVIDETILAPES